MCLFLKLLATSLLLVSSSAFAEAGYIKSVDGVVFVNRPSVNPIIAAKNVKVESGDEIETGADSSILIKMADGQDIYLQSRTRFKIEDFKYDIDKPIESKSVMSLIRGGLRSVTGLIGKLGNQDAYQMKAAAATIGIRGTEYSAVLCDQDCAVGKDGLNVYVIDGRIILRNEAGEFDLSAGEGALISDIRSKMTPLAPSEVQRVIVPRTMSQNCGA